jgi:hypothetical protein
LWRQDIAHFITVTRNDARSTSGCYSWLYRPFLCL